MLAKLITIVNDYSGYKLAGVVLTLLVLTSCNDYLEDYCEGTLLCCFDAPEELKEILAREQNALDRAMQRGKDEWDYNYPAERYAMNCIRLMERMGTYDETIEDYISRYWQLEDVRKYCYVVPHCQGTKC